MRFSQPRGNSPGPKNEKSGCSGSSARFGPRGQKPQTQNQDGGEGLKLKKEDGVEAKHVEIFESSMFGFQKACVFCQGLYMSKRIGAGFQALPTPSGVV